MRGGSIVGLLFPFTTMSTKPYNALDFSASKKKRKTPLDEKDARYLRNLNLSPGNSGYFTPPTQRDEVRELYRHLVAVATELERKINLLFPEEHTEDGTPGTLLRNTAELARLNAVHSQKMTQVAILAIDNPEKFEEFKKLRAQQANTPAQG